jgi:hypothetical protein
MEGPGRIRLTTSQTKDVHQLIAMGYERESCMQAVAMVGGTSFGPWLSYLNKESVSTDPRPLKQRGYERDNEEDEEETLPSHPLLPVPPASNLVVRGL